MLNDSSYYYTLNNIPHSISSKNIEIDKSLLLNINEKELMSQKYLLKYLNDFFEYNNIDYVIYNNTLLGHTLFNGINIFYDKIELIMMYRDFDYLNNVLLKDGFEIIFKSQYLIIISSSFFNKINVKAVIYFIHKNENTFYHLSPHFFNKCKSYKELLEQKEDYHITSINLHHIFPNTKVKYEDFEVYVPNKINELLEILELKKDLYSFDKTNVKKRVLKNNDENITSSNSSSNTEDIDENNHNKNFDFNFINNIFNFIK
jgi:hypothetical protein